MGDIDAKPDIGGFFDHAPTRDVVPSPSLRHGADDHGHGLVVDLGAGHSSTLAPQWRLFVGDAKDSPLVRQQQTTLKGELGLPHGFWSGRRARSGWPRPPRPQTDHLQYT